jgi:hypothetical protein
VHDNVTDRCGSRGQSVVNKCGNAEEGPLGDRDARTYADHAKELPDADCHVVALGGFTPRAKAVLAARGVGRFSGEAIRERINGYTVADLQADWAGLRERQPKRRRRDPQIPGPHQVECLAALQANQDLPRVQIEMATAAGKTLVAREYLFADAAASVMLVTAPLRALLSQTGRSPTGPGSFATSTSTAICTTSGHYRRSRTAMVARRSGVAVVTTWT